MSARIRLGPERRTRIECAIARGESNSAILATEGITYRQLRDVKAVMAGRALDEDEPPPPAVAPQLHRPRDTYFGPASQATIDALIDALFPGHTQENKRRRQAARRAVA